MVGFVIDEEDITPVLEHPLNNSIRVLLRSPAHRSQHGCGNETPLLNDFLANPVVAFAFELDRLPVLDHHVWLKFLKIFRGHHIELFIEIMFAARLQTVAAGDAAHAVANGKIGHEDEEVGGECRATDFALMQR